MKQAFFSRLHPAVEREGHFNQFVPVAMRNVFAISSITREREDSSRCREFMLIQHQKQAMIHHNCRDYCKSSESGEIVIHSMNSPINIPIVSKALKVFTLLADLLSMREYRTNAIIRSNYTHDDRRMWSSCSSGNAIISDKNCMM